MSRFDGENFTHFTQREGLSSNIVYSIVEDEWNNLWMSTESGIISLANTFDDVSPNDRDEKITLNCFVKNDGLKALDFYYNSVCLDGNNRIWWGSGKGLTMLDLSKNSRTVKPLCVNLKQIDINEHSVDYGNLPDDLRKEITFDGIKSFENYPINLELSNHQNHLTFHFSAIDWSAPHKIQYSYLMDGLNTEWSQPSKEAKADYRNIPYGTYTFKVKAIGVNGQWSETLEYTFTIHPPWWQTWSARIGFVIVLLLLIFCLIRSRTANLKERQRELESEVNHATKEIREQKREVEQAHKEIKDSINHAERIQRSFLATDELLSQNLNDHFVFFQPKDVVSGDFYWAGKLANNNFAIMNADSTGHGVPGAIMSILNISSIEKAIDQKLVKPADIFNHTRTTIIERLKKDGSEEGGRDGMDSTMISFDFANNQLSYAAAQNPIWIIRNGELIEIKPEKMPVGKHYYDHIPFVGGEFEIQKGDQIYTLTDGFQDQFGGPRGKKFMVKKMREFVLSISHFPMAEQRTKIEDSFNSWKGDLEQVDDVCIIAIKI